MGLWKSRVIIQRIFFFYKEFLLRWRDLPLKFVFYVYLRVQGDLAALWPGHGVGQGQC